VASTTHAVAEVAGIIEKPEPANAPSNLGVVGRYILTPAIFEMLEHTSKGSGGEIQLTDAIAKLLEKETVMAFQFQGKRYDCGNKLGYLEATIAYALKHPEIAQDFQSLLRDFVECIA
jgi:UTP--glucose-1-phosphate uridylyltransferase